MALCNIFSLAHAQQLNFTGSNSFVGESRTPKKGDDFALRDKDRVIFFGDSITEARFYSSYIEQYVSSRYPARRVTFINTGWGGDKVTSNDCEPCDGGPRGIDKGGALARVQRDVIRYQPTVVTLLFGMNDGEYKDFDAATLKVYVEGLAAIIHEIKKNTQARIYVMTPTVYDGTRHTSWSHTDKYNDVLDRYSAAAKELAAREKLPVIDLHRVTTEALDQARAAKAGYTFVPDGVHPDENGHMLMAAEILRVWGARANGFEITEEARGASANLDFGAPIAWPIPAMAEPLRKVRPEVLAMGDVRLRVEGLAAGRYALQIDGTNTGEYTAEMFGRGIPLAAATDENARLFATLIKERNDLLFMNWRRIEVPPVAGLTYQSAGTASAALMTLAEELSTRARQLGTHQYHVIVRRVS